MKQNGVYLFNKDYREIINKIPDNSIDLILTAPPFEYVQGGMKSKKIKQPKGQHVTMNPVELLKQYIQLSTNENDLVLDPFVGIGSAPLACLKNNRKFIGSEIDNDFYQIAKKRIEQNQG